MFKRLRKEAADAKDSTEPDLVLAPNQDNLQKWRAWVAGPADTPFEGGVFEIELDVGVRYPLAPPKVRVKTPLFHPNIHGKTGEVCLDILKEAWSPAWTLMSTVRAVRALLAAPNADSPLNCDAGNLIRANDWNGFAAQAKRMVAEHASQPMPLRSDLFPVVPTEDAPSSCTTITVVVAAVGVALFLIM
jgi:peroxin-4